MISPKPGTVTPLVHLVLLLPIPSRRNGPRKDLRSPHWLTNMATAQEGNSLTIDTRAGVFRHSDTILDFSQQELQYVILYISWILLQVAGI